MSRNWKMPASKVRHRRNTPFRDSTVGGSFPHQYKAPKNLTVRLATNLNSGSSDPPDDDEVFATTAEFTDPDSINGGVLAGTEDDVEDYDSESADDSDTDSAADADSWVSEDGGLFGG
ncbi:hypothetical protein DFH08DRAFT_956065 [Mycena albidolilacea]|uniref:Uncharacterized protein n=1 Tax=Mycena albidolilacea TaxID=1033008 RepID=A0AAD7ACS1_9AGAR|nr:hypothetical protein DFH08DRAFT_956065 [Mycena albidolilacea]